MTMERVIPAGLVTAAICLACVPEEPAAPADVVQNADLVVLAEVRDIRYANSQGQASIPHTYVTLAVEAVLKSLMWYGDSNDGVAKYGCMATYSLLEGMPAGGVEAFASKDAIDALVMTLIAHGAENERVAEEARPGRRLGVASSELCPPFAPARGKVGRKRASTMRSGTAGKEIGVSMYTAQALKMRHMVSGTWKLRAASARHPIPPKRVQQLVQCISKS